MVTDPVADMLTRIRNALLVRQDQVVVPTSTLKEAVAHILREQGFIRGYELVQAGSHKALRLHLKYGEGGEPVIQGLTRVSKPSLRTYVGWQKMPRVLGGRGTAILSTSQGVLTGQEARHRRIGGEVICYVW